MNAALLEIQQAKNADSRASVFTNCGKAEPGR